MLKKDLLNVADLSDQDLKKIILKAAFEKLPSKAYSNKVSAAALVFFENSSRTRMSFERACQVVGRPYSVFDVEQSSISKGETLKETFEVLHDYGYRYFIVRIKEEGLLRQLQELEGSHVISAGEGTVSHPTQVLGDAAALLSYTKKKDIKALKGLKMAIVGDLLHSRVAKSWYDLAPRLGIKLTLVSPHNWRPDWGNELPYFDSLRKAQKDCDAIMALRVQRERHGASSGDREWQNYLRNFQLRKSDLTLKQVYLHPGPTNWGVELSEELYAVSKANLISLQRKKCFHVRALLLS
jgi:aspartate carbamoyltransferase catalytic subunit